MLLYVFPVVFAVGGIAFPIGVLLYWTDLEPVDDGPAVLRDPQQPGARHAGGRRQGGARRAPRPPRRPARRRRCAERGARGAAPPRRAQQPKRQTRSSAKKQPARADGQPGSPSPRATPDRHRRPEPPTPTHVTTRRPDDRPSRGDARDRGGPTRRPTTADEPTAETTDERRRTDDAAEAAGPSDAGRERLEQEGDIAADYLEELLDIADLDGDLDMDVEGDRAACRSSAPT